MQGGSPAFEAALRAEIATELGRAKICATSDKEGALAKIVITLPAKDAALVRVDDAVTTKSVERKVAVDRMPDDGKALAIAIAADELLRASWAEVTLRPEEPKAPVPEVVKRAVASAAPKPIAFERKTELGLRTTLAVYGGGQTHVGGALYLRRDLAPWLTAELAGYARQGTTVAATDGTIQAHAAGGGLALDLHVVRVGAARIGVEAGVDLGWVGFDASARAPATSSSFSGVACFGRFGLVGAAEIDRVRLGAAILGLAPFRAVAVDDGTDRATSVGGAGLQAAIGAGVAF